MAKVQVFENRPPVLGINSLGRIGKLTSMAPYRQEVF